MIVEERLGKELKELQVLPKGYAGFKKRTSTADNVYNLSQLAEKCISKKGGKVYKLFVDLKTASLTVWTKRDCGNT